MMVEIMEKIRVKAGIGEGNELEVDLTAAAPIGGPDDGVDDFGIEAAAPIDTKPAAKTGPKSNGKADAKVVA
jgi:hypothetical protein